MARFKYYDGTKYNRIIGGSQPHNNLQPYIIVYMLKITV